MAKTIGRSTRRIGLLPTTYKTVEETLLTKDENGKEVETVRTKKLPIRHYEKLSAQERAVRAEKVAADIRADRKARAAKKSSGLLVKAAETVLKDKKAGAR